MIPPQIPLDQLPQWAQLAGIEFSNVNVEKVEGKGWGLFHVKDSPSQEEATLLRIPHDAVLSAEAVEDFAKVDQNFRKLLDLAGHESTRKDVLLYLYAHLATQSSGRARKPLARSPWTTYINFLPRDPVVPTQWSENERELLVGTSLEAALKAKLKSLSAEFDELLGILSNEAGFWSEVFSDRDFGLQQWTLVDSWYRSRSLELPQNGHAMVPGLDMANHSHGPNAYYEENRRGEVLLLLRPGVSLLDGREITISYGDAKSAAEMLFSYGFIDQHASKEEMTLALDSFSDDPLAKAKLHVYGGPPTVLLSRSNGVVTWSSPLLHLMCLNEEDGLEFRVLQDATGKQQLRMFWQDEDVTERANDLEKLTEDHPLCSVFRLRAAATLSGLITAQLERIRLPLIGGEEAQNEQGHLKQECLEAAKKLKEIETSILEDAAQELEQGQATLLRDRHVVAYLGLTEDTQNEQAPVASANEDDDFS